MSCTYATQPDEFRLRESRIREDVHARALKFSRVGPRSAAADIPRRNFIDEAIFGNLAARGVAPAPLASDEEFLRRVYLDLTGRLPQPDDIRSFISDSSPQKRENMIDTLLYDGRFAHRWTMWMGDLVQNAAQSANISQQLDGRNAFYVWLRDSIFANKSFKDLAYEVVTGSGNNYDHASGAANFPLRSRTPMGPAQDTYDAALARTAAAFLGLSYYDCLLCHDGRRRLDQVSLWGSRSTRLEAQYMAAFFSRQRLTRSAEPRGAFYYNSFLVTDAAAGTYALNTNFGNRPNRTPVGSLRDLTPEYRTGGKPIAGLSWRESFAHYMTQDRLFSINAVNRIWRQFFGLALVDPVDTLDPARLDPSNPPPEPWTLQATHPELLVRLADEFIDMNFNMREFIKLLLQSSAYQLSSRYPGEWKYEYLPLFARHYPRRLDGEEVHDVLSQASGVFNTYTLQGLDAVRWAVELPEPREPRSNGAARLFMDVFFRGDRDTQQRQQSGSVLQQLYLMNDAFVLNRIRAAAPTLQAAARWPNERAVEEIFLLYLGRLPVAEERVKALAHLSRAGSRNSAIEDLAWVCVNKLEFLFSY